jgi:cleavage and polyadenylation specificity factor subunit 5
MLQIANAFFKLYVFHFSSTAPPPADRKASCCVPLLKSFFIVFLAWYRPGDYLKPGEDEIEGLKRRLDERLAPPADSRQFNASHGVNNEWEIGDCLAQWWRPNFETFMVCPHFVYLLPFLMETLYSIHSFRHTSPNRKNAKSCSLCRCQNEVRDLYFLEGGHGNVRLVLAGEEVLAVPKNMKLLAIPLFELYDNAAR